MWLVLQWGTWKAAAFGNREEADYHARTWDGGLLLTAVCFTRTLPAGWRPGVMTTWAGTSVTVEQLCGFWINDQLVAVPPQPSTPVTVVRPYDWQVPPGVTQPLPAHRTANGTTGQSACTCGACRVRPEWREKLKITHTADCPASSEHKAHVLDQLLSELENMSAQNKELKQSLAGARAEQQAAQASKAMEKLIGDAERQRTLDWLGEALAGGHLKMEEYEAASGKAWDARTQPELDTLTARLPVLERKTLVKKEGQQPAQASSGRLDFAAKVVWRMWLTFMIVTVILALTGVLH